MQDFKLFLLFFNLISQLYILWVQISNSAVTQLVTCHSLPFISFIMVCSIYLILEWKLSKRLLVSTPFHRKLTTPKVYYTSECMFIHVEWYTCMLYISEYEGYYAWTMCVITGDIVLQIDHVEFLLRNILTTMQSFFLPNTNIHSSNHVSCWKGWYWDKYG